MASEFVGLSTVEEDLLFVDDGLLDELVPLTEAEIGEQFDVLAEMAVNQPDDELAIGGIRQLVSRARELGEINAVRQMAMTLGALACMHEHLGGIASEVADQHGDLLGGKGHKHDDEATEKHDMEGCANCKAGKFCRFRHR